MFWGVFALGFHTPSQPNEAGDDLATGPIVVGQLMAELERICADGSWVDASAGPDADLSSASAAEPEGRPPPPAARARR